MQIKNSRNLKGVLFDMDGTLLDTSEGIINSLQWAINKLGLHEITDAEMRSFIGPPLQDSFVRVYGMNGDESRRACEVYREYYREKGIYEARVYEGIPELCKTLRAAGIKTAVATYKVEKFAFRVLRHFGIADCFDIVHGSQAVDNTLTKADIISLCTYEMAVEKEHTLLIGDSGYDAEGAAGAGVGFVGVTYGLGFCDAADVSRYNPVFIADSVENLKKFLFS